MKVQEYSYNSNKPHEYGNAQKRPVSPNFRSGNFGGALNLAGGAMQWIQDKGFLASFLIQDGLGMTAPRVGAAFLRDKEVTGKYNVQEGFEVLGREGLTGPSMMAVAPITMLIAAKFGKSTSVNTQLIKRIGNRLKEYLAKDTFNKELLKNKDKLKEAFLKDNVEKILKDTLGEEHATEEHITAIMEKLKSAENPPSGVKKGKHRNGCIGDIVNYISDLKYKTSSDLDMLEKVKLDSGENELKTYYTKDVFDALLKYSDDAITLNKNLENLTAESAESIKNSSIGKRLITNVTTIFATLAILFTLPKIYASNPIAPGTRTAMALRERDKAEKAKANEANLETVEKSDEAVGEKDMSFKGAAKKSMSVTERLGKYAMKNFDKFNDKYSSELEYNGHNFTNSLMAGLSLFGLITPRGLRAYKRAQVDEEGRKDLTELYEIFVRDITSSLAVVFAVPMLTRAFVTSYEKSSGCVLMQKDRTKKGWSTFIDLLNPYSKAHVLTNKEIDALYNNITTKEKMLNFCEYISNNEGDIQKIISKADNAEVLMEKEGFNMRNELAGLSKSDKNKKLKEFFNGKTDEFIAKLMKGVDKEGKLLKQSKIFSFARGLNSLPGIISTLLISPYILGWFIPRLTYANSRRLHAKEARRKEEMEKAKAREIAAA